MLDRIGSPATMGMAGRRFFGFVIGGSLPAALAANWLAGAWDQNPGLFVASPIGTVLEEISLGWLLDVLKLPAGSGGAFVTGATVAYFTALAAARHAVLERVGWDVEADGLFGAPPITVVVGDEAHPSLIKVLGMLGLGRSRVIYVPVDSQGRMRASEMPRLPGQAIVCMQAGNVNTGAFDPAHSCPKQVLSASFSQPNPLICSSAGGHRKTRSMTARGSCPGRCLARTREAETRNLLKHGVLRRSRSYSLWGERLRPFAACPKRDWRKAVLDKTGSGSRDLRASPRSGSVGTRRWGVRIVGSGQHSTRAPGSRRRECRFLVHRRTQMAQCSLRQRLGLRPRSSRAEASHVAERAYLPQGEHREPSQYTPELSRRARGVEIWAAFRSLGRAGLSDLIERTCHLAARFATELQRGGCEILNEVVLNQVLVSFGDPARTRQVIERVQRDGTCRCGPTEWQGRTAMRISVSSWATRDEDVDRSVAAILRASSD